MGEMEKNRKAVISFIIAMLIFGSIGIFVKNIELGSASIVLWRTIIGSIFLSMIFVVTKQRINFKGIKKNLIPLVIAGLVLGGEWVFLFEAYTYTTVSTATMIYYCAPLIVFILSPLLFKEKIRLKQVWCIGAAVVGMVLVNGIGAGGLTFSMGVIYALLSAVLYAALMITNKYIDEVTGLESTWCQLIIAAVVMMLYVGFTTGQVFHLPRGNDVWLVLAVGVIHTGIACYLYFSSMQKMPSQSISVLSYIDPCSALIFSMLFLGERMGWMQVLGAILIFGGTLSSQMLGGERKAKRNVKEINEI